MGGGRRWLGAVVAGALATGACAGDPALPRAADDGWRRVDVPGTVRAVSVAADLVVASEDGGRVTVAVVRGSGVVGVPPGRLGDGPRSVGALAFNGETVMLRERTEAGEPAVLWSADARGLQPDGVLDWTREPPLTRQGAPAGWLEPLLDGEADYRAVGAVRRGPAWSLHGWQEWDGWVPLDRGLQLHTRAAPDTLLTGTTETTVVVAGPVSAGGAGGAGTAPQVWSLDDGLVDDPASPGRWVREPMASVPDAITDVADWDLGWWVAGHRDLRPVVYDFDLDVHESPGRELPVPDTGLDPRHPVVLVAGIPVTTTMVLVTQSVDGIRAWVDQGGDRWTSIEGPPGVVTGAVLVDGGLYLTVDGVLWYRPLTPPPAPSSTAGPTG